MTKIHLPDQDFITVNSIAKFYMVSPATVRRWIMSGSLGALKLPGGHYRVRLDDLKVFSQRNNMPPPEELFK